MSEEMKESDTGARQNHTEMGLKICLNLYLWDFVGGSRTKHKSCRRKQEDV